MQPEEVKQENNTNDQSKNIIQETPKKGDSMVKLTVIAILICVIAVLSYMGYKKMSDKPTNYDANTMIKEKSPKVVEKKVEDKVETDKSKTEAEVSDELLLEIEGIEQSTPEATLDPSELDNL